MTEDAPTTTSESSDIDTAETTADSTPVEVPTESVPADTTDDVNAPTYPLEYVKELRAEAAEHRTKAKALQLALVNAWATVDGRLVDPSDLRADLVEVNDDGTITLDAVTAAIDALVSAKPHLKRQRPAPLPQGAQADPGPVSLADILRSV